MLNHLRSKLKDESGSEAIQALFTIPIFISLFFVIVDTSLYFSARSTVEDIARDAARQVAIQGGNNSPLNPTGRTIAQETYDVLVNANGNCTPGKCTAPPTVTCTPTIVTSLGQDVSCTVIYNHDPLTVDMFGMTKFLHKFEVTAHARSEVYF